MSDEPTAAELAAATSEPPKGRRKAPPREYLLDIHRLLPQSGDAERGTLCSILLAPKEVLGYCAEKSVGAEFFHIPAHGTIYTVLREMWNARQPIDVITLTEELHKRKPPGSTGPLLDQVGGPAFVTELFTFLPTAANATYYLEILEEKYTLREIIRVGTEYASRAYDETSEPAKLLEDFEVKSLAIAKSVMSKKQSSTRDIVMDVLHDMDFAVENRGKVPGLTTGFPMLDQMIGGLQKEMVYIIAARPSMGKTAIAMNIAEHIALELKKPIAVFSLEMSSKQLVQRLICSRARVNPVAVQNGWITDQDFPEITKAATEIAEAATIHIDDESALPIQTMRGRARRLQELHAIEAIFIDYLQLARSDSKRAQQNRELEIAEISAGCKAMAKELGIPVVVLAQVGREVAKQKRRPTLADLRESGAIEQDADVVAFVHRQEMLEDDPEERAKYEGEATFIIAKQRTGPLGDVTLRYLKEFTRFENPPEEAVETELGLGDKRKVNFRKHTRSHAN